MALPHPDVFAARHLGDDLLGQHVERLLRDAQRVQLAAPHGVEQRGALGQVVEREREQAAPASSRQDDSQRRTGNQIRSPRRSAAASRATTSVSSRAIQLRWTP